MPPQGRLDDARNSYGEALAIQEAALGGEHPDVARTLSALAAAYDAQGGIEAAAPLHDRALRIVSDILQAYPQMGRKLAPVLTKLAALVTTIGCGQEAAEIEARIAGIRSVD